MSTSSWTDVGLSLAARGAASAAGLLGGPRLSTLIFHRVLPEPDAIFPGELDAVRFERLMRFVARAFHVLPLADAVARLARNELPLRAAAITFDDGYADNHDVAMPILKRLGLPATVFVATSFLDGGRMWNDTVIECLRRTRESSIDLSEFGLGVMPTVSAADRRQAIGRLLPQVKYQVPADREPMLERLHDLCGRPDLPADLMMSSDQVRALQGGGLGVGAHTVHHPILCTLPDEQARTEMAESRMRLEQLTQAPVTLFAYPNGQPDKDFDARHAAMARELGFSAALTTRHGAARCGADPYHLPRYTPWETGVARWALQLTRRHVSG